MTDKNSPYHPGEIQFQKVMGVDERLHAIGNKILRTHIIEQHRLFFESMAYVFISVLDELSRPWSFMLEGDPGFIQVVKPDTVRIHHSFDFAVPNLVLDTNGFLAMVSVDYSSRRRNLLNGYIVATSDQSIDVRIKQSLGNCPKYIQTRRHFPRESYEVSPRSERTSRFASLSGDIQDVISKSDTFYLGSGHPQPDKKIQNQGIDINHRGGKPGFVQVKTDTRLCFDNYPGNNMFYSFGNIELNPSVGLLFIDFELGDLYYLTGKATIEKDDQAFSVIFELDIGYVEKKALQSGWEFLEYSPALDLI